MAFQEVNNNTYNIEMDEEKQQEALDAYKETLKHFEDNNDGLTKFYKGATVVSLAAGGLWLLRKPIGKAAKTAWNKASGFVREKVFHKPEKSTTVNDDGTIDAEFTEVEEP